MSPRRVTCERCGAEFSCDLSGACWCVAEPTKLPLPVDAMQDCLCPDCLRKAATLVSQSPAPPD